MRLFCAFYEWAGKESDVTVRVFEGARSAAETNLMESAASTLPVNSGSITVHTKPYEDQNGESRLCGNGPPEVKKRRLIPPSCGHHGGCGGGRLGSLS